mgnify:CR=1 FL=1
MPIVSKTVEVSCDETTILSIVADFEAYPQWNEEVKGCWILHRYDDGRPSQLRLDTEIQGLDQAAAENLVAAAHQVCPYSNAVRGNVDVGLTVRAQ